MKENETNLYGKSFSPLLCVCVCIEKLLDFPSAMTFIMLQLTYYVFMFALCFLCCLFIFLQMKVVELWFFMWTTSMLHFCYIYVSSIFFQWILMIIKMRKNFTENVISIKCDDLK